MTNETNNEKEDYCRPRPMSEAYLVPPVARPVTILSSAQTAIDSTSANNLLATHYSTVPTPTPIILPPASTNVLNSKGLDSSLQGYMKMYPASKYSFEKLFHLCRERIFFRQVSSSCELSRISVVCILIPVLLNYVKKYMRITNFR